MPRTQERRIISFTTDSRTGCSRKYTCLSVPIALYRRPSTWCFVSEANCIYPWFPGFWMGSHVFLFAFHTLGVLTHAIARTVGIQGSTAQSRRIRNSMPCRLQKSTPMCDGQTLTDPSFVHNCSRTRSTWDKITQGCANIPLDFTDGCRLCEHMNPVAPLPWNPVLFIIRLLTNFLSLPRSLIARIVTGFDRLRRILLYCKLCRLSNRLRTRTPNW